MGIYKHNEELIARTAQSFPDTFGLRAFPGDTFKILLHHSYVNGDGVMLYTGRLMPGGTWASFAKGTPAELRKEVVALPDQPAPSVKADGWQEVLHGPPASTVNYLELARALKAAHPLPVTEKKPKDLIDARAHGDLRLILLSRMIWIDQTYPHKPEGSNERTAALEALVHLTHELGFDCEGLLWDEDGDTPPKLTWTEAETSHS